MMRRRGKDRYRRHRRLKRAGEFTCKRTRRERMQQLAAEAKARR